MNRSARPIASDLLEAGWLPPLAAADALGITVKQLEARARRGEIKRKQLAPDLRTKPCGAGSFSCEPNTSLFLYEVAD